MIWEESHCVSSALQVKQKAMVLKITKIGKCYMCYNIVCSENGPFLLALDHI